MLFFYLPDKLVPLGDCLFARGLFFVFLMLLLRTPDQTLTSGCVAAGEVSDKAAEERGRCARKNHLAPPELPSAGCLQGVLLASCPQHQLFFSVSPWPDNNIPAGRLIALLGHGLYYACLMDN